MSNEKGKTRVQQAAVLAGSVAVFGVVLMLGPASGAAMQNQRSTRDGVYTDEQAERGDQVFQRTCAACHLPEEFVGASYMGGWEGMPIHTLFDLVRRTMPEDNPGSLPRQQYADILAFLLKLNGAPAGGDELRSTDAELKAVRIEGPFKEGSGARPGSRVGD